MIIGERNTMGQFAEEDEETGLNHFEARLWDSRLGRWLTTDPAGQYASPYLGMGNNPINGVDPDGEWVKGAGFWRNVFRSDEWNLMRLDALSMPNGTWGKINGVWTGIWVEGTAYASEDGATKGGYDIDFYEYHNDLVDWDNLGRDADEFFMAASMADGPGFAGDALGVLGFVAIKNLQLYRSGVINLFKATKGVVKYSDDLVRAAKQAYPKLAGKTQLHHITPKYLGGAKNGPLVPLDAAYHQQITNAFRQAWGYGQGTPSATQLQQIMKQAYSKYPLPPGY